MGIYDREYYRDETRGSSFFSGAAPVCKALILANALVFIAQNLFQEGDSFLIQHFAASTYAIFHKYQIYRLITATFIHGGFFHLLVNMLLLWIAGREMEAMYGGREFGLLYATAAAFSTLCWAVADSLGANRPDIPMVGASGAVMAVVVLYTLYYPHRDLMLWGLVRIEIWMLLVVYLCFDFFYLMRQFQNGTVAGVAFASHLGGAAYGFLYKTYDLRWARLWPSRRFRPRLRVFSPEPRGKVSPLSTSQGRTATAPTPRASSGYAEPEEQLDAKLDEVLAKIAREGRGGLTEEENRVLEEASRRARDKRSDRV